jgi:hypothetical protein
VKRALVLLLLVLAAGCAKKTQSASRTRGALKPVNMQAPDDAQERTSIVSLTRGAVVVHRTGELLLDAAALRAIDGDPTSYWMAPPNDLPQSMIIALPARTRIDKVGVRTDDGFPTNHLNFERSIDGTSFLPMLSTASKPVVDPQWFDVAPGEATHIRVTIVDQTNPGRQVALRSLMFKGAELEAPRAGDLSGCWAMNDLTARFERKGSALRGSASMATQPMLLDGGFDGRVYRFNWIRGNDYGYALLAVAPDGSAINGIEWHEEAIPLFFGESWYGAKKSCAPIPVPGDIRERYLKRASRYSLFGLRFHDDGTIDREQSAETLNWLARFAADNPVQLVGYEFRRENDNENRAFARREVDSLMNELQSMGVKAGAVTFVVKGSDTPRQKPESDAARAMYSTIDVEIRR